jgi:hypothetical protein
MGTGAKGHLPTQSWQEKVDTFALGCLTLSFTSVGIKASELLPRRIRHSLAIAEV